MCKKAGVNVHKYNPHISENCFERRSDKESITKGMGGILENRDHDVKQFHKYGNRRKRDLKDLKKKNKILYIMFKRSITRHVLKKIKKIRTKASKNNDSSISGISGSESDSFLYSESEWYERR